MITGPKANSFALEIPALQVSGGIVSGGTISGAVRLGPPRVVGIFAAKGGIIGAIDVPAIRAKGKIISGSVVSGTLALPAMTVSATIVHQNLMSGAVAIPAVIVHGQISQIQIATASGAPIRRAFVMNLSHYGITEYSDYSFNSLCDYHGTGLYLGASEDGIFILDGNDDVGAYINAYVLTGTEDLWAEFVKKLREGFVGKRGGPIAIDLILDEGRFAPVTRKMNFVTEKMHEERCKFPRGLKNRFTSFVVRNLSGNDFSLESLRIFLDDVRRKIR